MNKAGDSGTGDPSSSTCYGGICMPACSQMVLDRWLLIFCWFSLFVCMFFFVFFLSSICKCLLVFVMVESPCKLARRWSWTGGSWYLVDSFCLFVSFFVFFLSSICMCLLVFLVFVFLVFLWWWNLHASLHADGPGEVALDIWLVVSFSRVCFWMFFFLFLFLCLSVGFSCLCFCVGGIWGPACWQMILDRLCSLVVFKFWI